MKNINSFNESIKNAFSVVQTAVEQLKQSITNGPMTKQGKKSLAEFSENVNALADRWRAIMNYCLTPVKEISFTRKIIRKTGFKRTPPKTPRTRQNVEVQLANGTVLKGKDSLETMVEFIKHIGPAKVAKLRMTAAGNSMLAKKPVGSYAWKPLSNGWLLCTHLGGSGQVVKRIRKILEQCNIPGEVMQVPHQFPVSQRPAAKMKKHVKKSTKKQTK